MYLALFILGLLILIPFPIVINIKANQYKKNPTQQNHDRLKKFLIYSLPIPLIGFSLLIIALLNI